MKLHIGCGERRLPGYLHCDSRPLHGIDFVCKAWEVSEFIQHDSVSEIYHCALLEHLPVFRVSQTLISFFKILKHGGRLVSSVPNFQAIIHMYRYKAVPLQSLFGMLYGKGDYKENVHHCMFDEEYFRGLLNEVGFTKIKHYDWRDFLPEGYDDFSRAYMPHMDFKNGTQMMLNMMANKP